MSYSILMKKNVQFDPVKRKEVYYLKENIYCKKNNIPLIRIPYWKYEELTIKDLILEKV